MVLRPLFIRLPRKTIAERFWPRVTKTAECWLWDGPLTKGYGVVSANGRTQRAHRVSWQLRNGPVAPGSFVLHQCDVRNCVNPDHLFLGTKADNNKDRAAKGRSAKRWSDARRQKHVAKNTETLAARLTPDVLAAIASSASARSVERDLGVDRKLVSGMRRGVSPGSKKLRSAEGNPALPSTAPGGAPSGVVDVSSEAA